MSCGDSGGIAGCAVDNIVECNFGCLLRALAIMLYYILTGRGCRCFAVLAFVLRLPSYARSDLALHHSQMTNNIQTPRNARG